MAILPDFSDVKRQVRRLVHDRFAYAAEYRAHSSAEPVEDLRVRWHARGQIIGDLAGGEWAQVEEQNDRIVFDKEEMARLDYCPAVDGLVVLLRMPGQPMFRLMRQAPDSGPINNTWLVVPVS